jgi:glycosyltransferase involved in cell wall biosynthesis
LRIGVDASALAHNRGFGRMARRTLQALVDAAASPPRHQIIAVLDHLTARSVTLPPRCEALVVETSQSPLAGATAQSTRNPLDMLRLARAAARARLDAFWFPASFTYYPVWNVGPVVVTIHDVLPLRYPNLVFPTRTARAAWQIKERLAVLQASRVLAPSHASRRDVLEIYRLPPHAVGVVPEAPDEIFHPATPDPAVLARWGVTPDHPLFLYVGGLSPHKNLLRLIDAFALAQLPPHASLLLVGDLLDRFHTHIPEIRARIAYHRLDSRIRLTGFVPDADLLHLYNHALALVQPSLLEGFGLPPVEAMACGTPVLYSASGSLPEVVGPAGIPFEPWDVPAIARALEAVASLPGRRRELAAAARARAARWDWSRIGAQLLDEISATTRHRRRGRAPRPHSMLDTRAPRAVQ